MITNCLRLLVLQFAFKQELCFYCVGCGGAANGVPISSSRVQTGGGNRGQTATSSKTMPIDAGGGGGVARRQSNMSHTQQF